ncbi:MAG: replicative superfamily II helicase [Rickettsiales bacterium]|jgi:replicative superfamily II helicase
MSNQLINMMAEIESWESAVEFGIPENSWAQYQVRERSDDLYIALFSNIFDTLRIDDIKSRERRLSEIAKTLLIYSRSAASKYLVGIDKNINLLYCAATFYLAGFPATATLILKKDDNFLDLTEEEQFLYKLLGNKLDNFTKLDSDFLESIESNRDTDYEKIIFHFQFKESEGLKSDPRLFIASKLIGCCLKRFKSFNVWKCLRENASNFSNEIWRPFLTSSYSFPLRELFPSQMEAIKSGILSDKEEVYSLQMPTSSGKTSLCEILIFHEVKVRKKKVLFLVPFRALAAEIKGGISKRLRSAYINVVSSYGGNIPTGSDKMDASIADVLIITPEKFIALNQSFIDLEVNFDTIICDEGHLIDDDSRGLQYELLLTKLKSSEDCSRKIVFISAILPNVDEIHEWLGGSPEQLSKSNYNPVETDFAFIQKQKDSWNLNFNTIYDRPRNYFLTNFLTKDDFRYVNPVTSNLNLIEGYKSFITLSCAASLKGRKNGSVALFTTQKGKSGVAGLSKKMLQLHNLGASITNNAPKLSIYLPDLINYISFQFGSEYSLTQLLKYGIGFHHGDLPQEIRREMEDAIQNNIINILICTSTLAEGVNLPIRTLVVHTIKRFDFDTKKQHPIDRRSIKNIVGRVGRAGKETKGRIIFSNSADESYVQDVFKDVLMEPARGSLFQLIEKLNKEITTLKTQLSNEVLESSNKQLLPIIDKIDEALIDFLPENIIIEDIGQHIENILKLTLAYKYCVTNDLKNIIKEVFSLRAERLTTSIPREQWIALKKSGSSFRFWDFINTLNLVDREEWKSLSSATDKVWIDEIIMSLLDSPNSKEYDKGKIKKITLGWISGLSYKELAESCEVEIEEILKLLNNVSYGLQDASSKLTQLAISRHGYLNLSEVARKWPSLLQYGLNSLQQLDMFAKGASDRLAVWGISRYLERNEILLREGELIEFIRENSEQIIKSLDSDTRVPKLSVRRVCEELEIF